MSKKFEASLQDGVHKQLSKMEGKWAGIAKVWFEPGNPVDESPVSGTMRTVLNGRFILHEYEGKFGDKPLQGLALYGYHLELEKYECAWVDSFHNNSAMMFSQGKKQSKEFDVLGSYAYVTPEEEQYWGWRTEISMPSDDEIIITAYNISPAGEESKATEIAYKRVR